GILFLLTGLWILVRKPVRRRVEEPPKLLAELQAAGPRRAFAIGIVLAVLNPNLFLMISAMTAISSSATGTGTALVATLALLIAAAIDFLVPIGVYLLLGDRAEQWLDTLQSWMVRHTRALSLAVLFGFGALFTVRGLTDLL
ncbi:MAG: hypothetical protein HOQ36_25235, partial [Nocardia sp.]|nr:hypothetical protein [Nocardia sp.]